MRRTAAIVPFKGSADAKSRLEGALPRAERQRLACALLHHVLDVLHASGCVDLIAVISPQPIDCVTTIHDRGQGLNAAIQQGMEWVQASGADLLLVIPADLPLLSTADIHALIAAVPTSQGIVLAPSKGGGTGALALRPPTAIQPAFGPDSAKHHLARSKAAGLEVRTIERPGLSLDLDDPADLMLLERAGIAISAKEIRAVPRSL
jgi:2-phospho-L-lactate guanylyltransferase